MPMFRQSKRNSRIDRDMISGPLGDFRHTMHIGRGGDVFGDTSFLSKPGAPPDRAADATPLPSPAASLAAPSDAWPAPAAAGAKAKFSSPDSGLFDESAPRADAEWSFASRGSRAGAPLPAAGGHAANGKPADDGRVANGHPKPERSSGSDIESYDNYGGDAAPFSSPSGADPSMAFDLDLGPSMLDDILSIMDVKGSYGSASASSPERRDPAPRKTWEFHRDLDEDEEAGEGAGGRGRASRVGTTGDGHGAPAPRNWNHDSGVVYEAASPRRDDVFGGAGAKATPAPYASPSHTVRSAGSHASSGSSAESGVACEDERRKFSSGSFDKLSDDEPGESYTFDDDDDEIRV
ncbi:uncharacterized protein LOC144932789 [Lampetra fluviatilis]